MCVTYAADTTITCSNTPSFLQHLPTASSPRAPGYLAPLPFLAIVALVHALGTAAKQRHKTWDMRCHRTHLPGPPPSISYDWVLPPSLPPGATAATMSHVC